MSEQSPIVEVTVTEPELNSEIPASQAEVLEAEAIEQVTDSAVEIAQIEADKEVTIAAIHAEVETAAIEANANEKSEIEECRAEIARLTGIVDNLTETVNLLIPPPVLEVVATEELPIALETDLTQPSIAAPTVETLTEPLEESVEERPEETIPSRVRRFIAI